MSKFASLTSGLLAREGSAEPAATTYADELLKRVDASGPDFRTYGQTSTGVFNRRPPESSLFLQRDVPQAPDAGEPPVARPLQTPHPDLQSAEAPHGCHGDPDKTFHVNLRLKRKRFVRLKLASALLRRPTQEIVSDALDEWFGRLPPDMLGDCECMRLD